MQFIKVQQYRRQIRIFAYSYLNILNKKSTFLKPCLPMPMSDEVIQVISEIQLEVCKMSKKSNQAKPSVRQLQLGQRAGTLTILTENIVGK
jgi:hypothetical protein